MASDHPDRTRGVRHLWPAGCALALLLATLLAFWPGVAMYDTVSQYRQVLSGVYDDWHPPVMVQLWAALLPLGRGTAPLFILQVATYWLGLGALAQALGGRKAAAILIIGACPMFLGWQLVVLKDLQLVGALACGVGLAAFFRLRERRIPPLAGIGIAICLVYATLLRANAAFSTVPLAVLLFLPASGPRLRIAAALLGIPVALLATQLISHHLLGARDSGVSRIEAVYDLSGIAVRSGDVAPGGAPLMDVAALERGRCVKPLFWDSLTSRADCQAALNGLDRLPSGRLYIMLARATLAHPLAYAGHRFAHLNGTLRWLVPLNWPLAAPPATAEPNRLGLASPACCATKHWQAAAGITTETPLGWPILWVMLALWGLARLPHEPCAPRRALAFALLASALCQEASFAVLSISSDLRYHLWAMLAVALAWVLLWDRWGPRRQTIPALLALALVLLPGLWARLVLPPSATRYQDLLG